MKKYIISIILGILLIFPWFFQWGQNSNSLFFESRNEFSRSSYFETIFNLDVFNRYGMFNYGEYKWFFYECQNYILSIIFGSASGIIYIGIILLFGYIYLIKLLRGFYLKNAEDYKYIPFLSFIFFTSPSIFLYIKSTIAITAPAIIFPVQLYFLLNLLTGRNKINFVGLFISFLLISYSNLTSILLNIIFLFVFSVLYNHKKIFSSSLHLVMISVIVVLPLLGLTYLNSRLNFGNTTELLNSIREDFYHRNTSIINILKQTADWAFFGGFGQKLYFDFSSFYKNNLVGVIGLFFSLGLLFSPIINNFKSLNKKNTQYLIVIAIIILFMLGTNNFIYAYLYENFTAFHIFRNIQKLAPFFLLILIFFLVKNIHLINKKILVVIIGCGLFYNLPYFLYSNFFVSERIVNELPIGPYDLNNYLNQSIDKYNSKILLLPGVYTNESYKINDKNFNLGILYDRLSNYKTHRLSPQLNGDKYVQTSMKNLFSSDYNSQYGISPKIEKIQLLIETYNYSHIAITDNINKVFGNNIEQYLDLFSNDDRYKLVYQNQGTFLYENLNYKNIFSSNNKIYIETENYFNNVIGFSHLDNSNFIFYSPYNLLWGVFLGKEELEVENRLANDYANSWDISKEEIISHINKYYSKELKKEGYPKTLSNGSIDYKYYIENPDGSIDVELTLYFKPQLYFYIGLIISGTTFALLILWLIVDSVKGRRKKNKRIKI